MVVGGLRWNFQKWYLSRNGDFVVGKSKNAIIFRAFSWGFKAKSSNLMALQKRKNDVGVQRFHETTLLSEYQAYKKDEMLKEIL